MADEQDYSKFTVRIRRPDGWYPIVGQILDIFKGWGRGNGTVIDPANDKKAEDPTQPYDQFVPPNKDAADQRGEYFLDSTGHWFPFHPYLIWKEASNPSSTDGFVSWLIWNEANGN